MYFSVFEVIRSLYADAWQEASRCYMIQALHVDEQFKTMWRSADELRRLLNFHLSSGCYHELLDTRGRMACRIAYGYGELGRTLQALNAVDLEGIDPEASGGSVCVVMSTFSADAARLFSVLRALQRREPALEHVFFVGARGWTYRRLRKMRQHSRLEEPRAASSTDSLSALLPEYGWRERVAYIKRAVESGRRLEATWMEPPVHR